MKYPPRAGMEGVSRAEGSMTEARRKAKGLSNSFWTALETKRERAPVTPVGEQVRAQISKQLVKNYNFCRQTCL